MKMKLKSWHLYVLATLCFLFAFTSLNMKYDRFYRVNGIDNDNRSLIEKYLDKEEQDYLIDHGISVDEFIDYITYDQFHLQYYQYYNELKEAKKYDSLENLINDVNSVVDRLTVEFGTQTDTYFKTLIKNDLFYAYQKSTYFDFDNVRYYQLLRTLYSDDDYSYIILTNNYVNTLENEKDDTYKLFKEMVSTYDAQGLYILMNTELKANASRLYKIDTMSQVIDDTTFIGGYESKHMTMIENISRLSYSMYLNEEAYNALKQMYDDLYKNTKKRFLVTSAYKSYDVLNLEENTSQAGYSEFQLGTSVSLKVNGIKDVEFVSGHPMAGRENKGYLYASKEVFQGANYILIQHEENSKSAIAMMEQFVSNLGFHSVKIMSPQAHDEIISFTSQLPHVIAVSLIDSDNQKYDTGKYIGDSYRDLTRIANINEDLWTELFFTNKNNLLKSIQGFEDQLDILKKAIKEEDADTLKAMFIESSKRRRNLEK